MATEQNTYTTNDILLVFIAYNALKICTDYLQNQQILIGYPSSN